MQNELIQIGHLFLLCRLAGEKKLIQLMFGTPSVLNDIPLDMLKRLSKIILSAVLEKRESELCLPVVLATSTALGMIFFHFTTHFITIILSIFCIIFLFQTVYQRAILCKLNVDAAIN